MEFVGHVTVLERAGIASGERLWKEQLIPALLPNMAHCHEWAYEDLWAMEDGDGESRRLVQGHMICDWVIHHGQEYTPGHRDRGGWAYATLGTAVSQLDAFMDKAVASGGVDVDPRAVDTREHLERDFGHTAMEAALDGVFVDAIPEQERLGWMREFFARFDSADDVAAEVRRVMGEVRGVSHEPAELMEETVADYLRWSQEIESLHELAARGLLNKYGIADDHPVMLPYAMEFLAGLRREMEPVARDTMIDEVVSTIAEPALALAACPV